ncbi:MAG: sulfatase-like hydrolase/transferase, partial [Planctomycetes bacterium]|nr:sulfatase-like hydrolase/transferase [Planctomycetota bacterium]
QLEDTAAGPRVKARKNGKPTYDVEGADEKSFATDWLADKTVDFISEHKNEPFCYMVSIPDPHGPNSVRPPYDTMFADMTFDTPKTFDKPDGNVPAWGQKQKKNFSGAYLQKYFGMVKCIDDNVGKILNCLRKNRLIDNTIVVFTSDHGDLCGEHGRDNKGVPYEASAKIPFILYYPKMVKAATVIDQALGCVDFMPTIISMMGQKAPGTEQGRDASKLFTTGKAPAGWDDIIFVRESSANQVGWIAAVTGRYKLVFAPNEDPWLFDLEKDPDEITNFLNDPAYRETVRTLARKLRQYGQKYHDPYTQGPKAKADIQWAVSSEKKYVAAISPAGS